MGLLALSSAFSQQPDLVVVEKVSNSVGFYTSEGQRVAGVPVGKHPHEMVFSPDGRLLYVSDNGILWMTYAGEGGNTISIIDLEQRKRTGVIDLGDYRRPHGMDLDPRTGRMVVTIENPDGLLLIDPAARKVLRKYDVEGADPHMVILGPKAEWAYVSNTATAAVAAVHLETGDVSLIPTGKRPQGAVRSHDGKLLYVTNSESSAIAIIDMQKKENVGSIKTSGGPGRVALTPDGRQLVYNIQSDPAVGFADIASGKETARIPLPGPPLSLTLSADGRWAYTGVQSLDKVYIIDVASKKVARGFDTPRNSGPDPVLPLP